MRHVPPPTAPELTCADRARMGFDRLSRRFSRADALRAARAQHLDIDDAGKCMVAIASGTGSYEQGCVLLGIAKDGPEAVMLGFWMANDGGPDYEAYQREVAELNAEFRALGHAA
mgnify:CR=1 FL=1